MLTTNQRLDQLIAARDDFTERGMLHGTLIESILSSGMYNCNYHLNSNQTFSLDLLCNEDQDEIPVIELADPGASIADEDIDDTITDDVLAQVKFAQRSREFYPTLNCLDAKCFIVRL